MKATAAKAGRPKKHSVPSGCGLAMRVVFAALNQSEEADVSFERRVGLPRGALSRYRQGVRPNVDIYVDMLQALGLRMEITGERSTF